MSRIGIKCKAPKAPPGAKYTLIPDNVEATVTEDNGDSYALDNVTSITWRCKVGEEATATLEFVNVKIDAEADADAYSQCIGRASRTEGES